MQIKGYTQDDLEQMNYVELTELILVNNGSKMKIADIFRNICQILNMSDAEFENKIADFFELISTDSNFIILDGGFVDLRKKHAFSVVIENEEEDEEEDEESESSEDTDEFNEEDSNDIYYDNSSEEDDIEDDSDDELNDFILIDDEDETSI